MKKAAIIALAFVLTLTGTLYALTFIDINGYREDISTLVEEQTGRKLNLAGPLEVGFSLTPTIVAREVSFGNAPWGSRPYMLEAEEVGITLSLIDLIFGDVGVSRISAHNSKLLLEAHSSGAMNWEFETGSPAGNADAEGEAPVSLPDLDLTNVNITYQSQRIDQVFHLNLSSLSLSDGFLGTAVEAAGELDGLPVGLEGTFTGAASDFAVSDFQLSLGDMEVQGSGSAKRALAGGPYHAVLRVSANRADVTSWIDLAVANQQETVDMGAERRASGFMDQPLDLSLLDIATADVSVDVGRLDLRRAGFRNIAIKVQANASSAALDMQFSHDETQVRAAARIERADVPKVNVSGSFADLDLEQLADDVGAAFDLDAGAKASAKVVLSARGRTPRALLTSLAGTVDGTLSLGELDLTPLADVEGDTDPEPEDVRLFSNEELPLTFVDGFTGKIEVRADRVIYGNLSVREFEVPITFKGKQILSEVRVRYHDREVIFSHSAQLGSAPTMDFDLLADDFDMGSLLSELGVTDLADVRADVALSGSVAGRTPRALASSFTGSLNLVAGKGEIATRVFELIAADLVWALVPKGTDGGKAELTCVLNRIDFKDGVGTMSAFALVTKRMRTSGTGTINLIDETLDLTFYPKPNDTSLLSLSTPIRVTGSIADPSVRPDTTSLLLDAAKIVGAGALIGGIGALLPLMNLQNFDAEDAGACVNMLSTGNRGVSGFNETINSGKDAVTEGAGSIIKGVGDILTSPFK